MMCRDYTANIDDAVYLINYNFKGGLASGRALLPVIRYHSIQTFVEFEFHVTAGILRLVKLVEIQ